MLKSNNGNVEWDLDTGELEIKVTDFSGFVYGIGTENSRFRIVEKDAPPFVWKGVTDSEHSQ